MRRGSRHGGGPGCAKVGVLRLWLDGIRAFGALPMRGGKMCATRGGCGGARPSEEVDMALNKEERAEGKTRDRGGRECVR